MAEGRLEHVICLGGFIRDGPIWSIQCKLICLFSSEMRTGYPLFGEIRENKENEKYFFPAWKIHGIEILSKFREKSGNFIPKSGTYLYHFWGAIWFKSHILVWISCYLGIYQCNMVTHWSSLKFQGKFVNQGKSPGISK